MLNVILRSMLHFLPMDANCPLAMHAPYVLWRCSCRLGDRDFLPAPYTLSINNVLAAFLASCHEVMGHLQAPQQ